MESDRSARILVQKLADLSLENGLVSAERVQAVLQSLGQQSVARRRLLLPLYQKKIQKLLRETRMLLETPVAVADDEVKQLQEFLSRKYQRALLSETRIEPELLGGFRVRVGDDVYERSIQSTLQTYTAKLNF